MNLAGARAEYYTHSGSASAVGRQLAFGGLALVWIFKVSVAGVDRVPPDLLPAATLLAVALGFDLLQYVAASLLWGVYHRWKEVQFAKMLKRGETPPADFKAPRWINWPAIACFVLKLLLLVLGYVFLVRALIARWIEASG